MKRVSLIAAGVLAFGLTAARAEVGANHHASVSRLRTTGIRERIINFITCNLPVTAMSRAKRHRFAKRLIDQPGQQHAKSANRRYGLSLGQGGVCGFFAKAQSETSELFHVIDAGGKGSATPHFARCATSWPLFALTK